MLCSTCHAAERAKGQSRCAACHAEYQRDHRSKSRDLHERKAFSAGIQALRSKLVETFKAIGRGEMNGYTAAEYAANCKIDVPQRRSTGNVT
jgi:hypothetical protein